MPCLAACASYPKRRWVAQRKLQSLESGFAEDGARLHASRERIRGVVQALHPGAVLEQEEPVEAPGVSRHLARVHGLGHSEAGLVVIDYVVVCALELSWNDAGTSPSGQL